MRAVILLMVGLLGSAAVAQEEPSQKKNEFAVGLGMETRLQQDVNPDFGEARSLGQFYAKWRGARWSALLETSRESKESSSGSLSVKAESLMLGAWGRYDFFARDRNWSPYLGLGAGSYFDRVNTSFAGSFQQRSGTRKFAGLGAGVTFTVWEHLLLEGEARMNFVELTNDPVIAGVVRVGAVF